MDKILKKFRSFVKNYIIALIYDSTFKTFDKETTTFDGK